MTNNSSQALKPRDFNSQKKKNSFSCQVFVAFPDRANQFHQRNMGLKRSSRLLCNKGKEFFYFSKVAIETFCTYPKTLHVENSGN